MPASVSHFFGDMSPDYVGAALSEYSNFVTFPKAMVSLFVSYTGNWQGYFTDIYVDDRCYENTPLPADVTCSPRYVSVFYFVTYVITGVFFLGNLFIAIILERFSFCASEEGVGWQWREQLPLRHDDVEARGASNLS